MAETVTEKKLTPQQRKTIETLLTTGTIEAAAAAAGVSRNSIYKWFKDDLFVSELRQAESEAVAGLSRALVGLGEKATRALADALDSDKITIRLRASEIVIGNLLKIRELIDLESRLAALEANYEQQKTADQP